MANKKNAFTFFCLYIAQTIPMSFFSTVIPVIMRQENFSLTEIGMLQLIKLPWILKFLWSPIVDRYSVSVNDYKRWIFSSELIYAAIIFSVAFLDFNANFHTILVLIIISFIASATQDIATDALAALSFSKQDKSVVNSMQSMGSFGGTLIGSGLLLLLFRKVGGWGNLLPFLALFVIIALLPLLFNKKLVIQREKDNLNRANWKADILYLLTSSKVTWKRSAFFFLYYGSLIALSTMLRPYLGDRVYNILYFTFALLPLFFSFFFMLFSKKKLVVKQKEEETIKRASWADIFRFFARKSIWKQIGFLLLYYIPMIGVLAMLRPYLVDLGYDMKQIGLMSGIVGTASGMLASFMAGLVVKKIGRFYSRILFAVFIVFTTFYFYLISLNAQPDILYLYIGIIMLWGNYGMATVVVYTTAMDCVRAGREGTDFTIQTVLTHASGIGIAILSGKIADKLGYSKLFLFEFGLAALSLIYILTMFRKEKVE